MDFIRFEALIGKENFEQVKNLRIVVVGVGGVGGYVVESLARCGIEHLMVIDYDTVDISNKNRQIIALDDTIGLKKVDVFADRIQKINKNCEVLKVADFLTEENLSMLLEYQPDYIVDACDTLKTKEALISFSLKNKIQLISSMGTGKRIDASKLEITSLDKTSYDPIARILRKYCRDNHLSSKVPVLWSREIPKKTDASFIPSCSFVPSTAGLLITSYIINHYLSNKS